jgi:hypothetical protein
MLVDTPSQHQKTQRAAPHPELLLWQQADGKKPVPTEQDNQPFGPVVQDVFQPKKLCRLIKPRLVGEQLFNGGNPSRWGR